MSEVPLYSPTCDMVAVPGSVGWQERALISQLDSGGQACLGEDTARPPCVQGGLSVGWQDGAEALKGIYFENVTDASPV